jgi:hypothetical protein
MEFLLNGAGLRFDFGKTQGLFNKIARLKGYLLIWTVGSRSDDSDTFQLRWSDLHGEGPDGPIWIGPVRSDKNAAGGGEVAGDWFPRWRIGGAGRSRCSRDQNNSSLGLGGSARHG